MSCDAVVIGAGLNGMVAAWRLAKAGKKVVVCEARATAGGLALGEEFHPGYRTPGILHDTSIWRAWLADEMKLADHGRRTRPAPDRVIAPALGEVAVLPSSLGSGDFLNVDPSDVEALVDWRAFVERVAPPIRRLLDNPPPQLDASSLGEFVGLARDGWSLRRLGRETMTELLRVGPMPASDWLRERLRSETLIEALVAPVLLGTWLGPHSAGSAALLMAHECLAGEETVGGPGALVDSVSSACEAAGIEIETDAAVTAIEVESGAVVGVRCRDGREIACKQILASCNPRTALLDLLPPAVLPLAIRDRVVNFRSRGTVAKVHVALDGPLVLADREVELAHLGGGSIDALERAFDSIKYGRVSDEPFLEVRQPSVADSSLAPDGGHVLSILAGYVPYGLRSGWDEAARSALKESVLTRLEHSAPGLRGRVVGTELLTPVDLERRFELPGGQLHHGEHSLDQLLFVRPDHRLAHYSTPVSGLYLSGGGSHPGGGITGVPGWLGAGAALTG